MSNSLQPLNPPKYPVLTYSKTQINSCELCKNGTYSAWPQSIQAKYHAINLFLVYQMFDFDGYQAKFGKELARIRGEKGISQEGLAFVSDLSRSYLSGVERGVRNISLKNIAKIAAALDIQPSELLPRLEINTAE